MEKFSNVLPAADLKTLKYSGKMATADFVCNMLQSNMIGYNWAVGEVYYTLKVNSSMADGVLLNEICKKATAQIEQYFLNPTNDNLIKVHAALRAA